VQSQSSAGTGELESVSGNWKKQRLKPMTEHILKPTQCGRALLLSAVFATYSISLTHFSPALLDQGASMTCMEVVRDHSDPHTSTLGAVWS